MGLLKKITRPISKVLDKIVPNEIKPALPFLAAAAPFFGPTSGIMGTGIKRLLAGGGLNLAAQLAQEGSEGDFNPLSVGIAALTAGATDPGASSYLQSLKSPTGDFAPARTGLQKFTDSALDLGIKGVDKLQGLQAAVADKGILSLEGAKLASIPATQGTTDLAIAENRRLEKQLAIDEALKAAEGLADDAASASAIRNAMIAYGFFTDQEIEDTIASAGYANGGRVGFDNGGFSLTPTQQKMLDAGIGMFRGVEEIIQPGGDPNPGGDPDFSGIKGAVESVDENMRADRAGDFFRLRDEAIQKGDDDKIKEIESDFFKEFGMVMPKMAKDGGRIGLENGGDPEDTIEAYAKRLADEEDISYEEALKIVKEEYPKAEGFFDKLEKGLDVFKNPRAYNFAEGGLMNLGGKEMDLRGGGFVPIGKKEKADDVPARLSKNEFVMTADAVRAAGGGSVNKGAKRMYDLMNKLEARV